MAAIIPTVINPKTTGTMLYHFLIPSPGTKPLSFFAYPNTEKLFISFRRISSSTCNVLYLFIEVIVIGSWSNWISAQRIDVRVPESRSMYYLEAKILQHVYPPSSLAMRI
jgi:hypothetical protein